MSKTIEHHPTFDIHDSSKVQTFMSCPRRYFYRYVLGWERRVPNIHLVFGEAWHRAKETLLRMGYSQDAVAQAYVNFEDYYREHFGEMQDAETFPKNPANALNALMTYVKQYHDDRFQTMFTEVAGTVPIDEVYTCPECEEDLKSVSSNMCPNCGQLYGVDDMRDFETRERKLHFRLDSIVKENKWLYSLDHKTASRNSQTWRDSWRLSFQMATYAHALYCLESLFQLQDPVASVYGVIIDGSVFKKTGVEHVRIKIRKTRDMMRVFLWNAIYWLDCIDFEFNRLEKCDLKDDIMMAFPMNTQSCTDYGGCPYFDFCMSWPNPLVAAYEEPPPEFKKEYWNPEDNARDAKMLFYDGEFKEKKEVKKDDSE